MQLLIKLALIFTLTTLPLTHSASLFNTDDDDESNQEIEGEQNYEDDESNLFAKSEKKLFENFLQRKSDEEKSLLLRELKAKNIEDQKRRRVERKRRRRKSKSGKEKTKSRVNRNTRRYISTYIKHLTSLNLLIVRFNCVTDSAAQIVKLLMMVHSQKIRDRVAARWLRECGGGARSVKTTAVRYFG